MFKEEELNKEDEKTGSDEVLRGVAKDGEFRNWAACVQSAPAKVLRPRSIEGVRNLIKEAGRRRPMPKIRCMGSGHSWTPLFGDDRSWILNTTDMKDITWSADTNPTQVTIGPGVTPGELATFMDSNDRGKWRGLFLASDVVLETVTYGGTINSGCHGTGHTQTLCDYVLSTKIVRWDGSVVELKRADDPKGFALKILHFGLLGVTVEFTLQLDEDVNAIKITDSKLRARELFLEQGQLPGKGTTNPLLDLWNSTYGVEIFYFAASSLKVTNILSREFEDQTWDTSNDVCAIKAFSRTTNRVGRDNDSCWGIDHKASTRFDRNFSITDFLKVNLGTEVALPLVAKVGDRPALVSLYAKFAARAFEPVGKETGEVSYESSLGQVCIKCDPDFTSAYQAIHAAIDIIQAFAEHEGTLPLNVAMEMRFTKHSDSPLSPAYGKEGDVFMWIELLTAVNTPRLKDLFTKIMDYWLAVTLKDGSQAALPHWAKWSEAYILDADAKLKRAFGDRLKPLQAVAKEFDPSGVFVNDYFQKLFAP